MRCSIVILNWNGRQHLSTYLPSVVQHCPTDCEVVVADNGSTDDSVAFLRLNYPSVRLILLPENYGFAEGYNRALQQVDADYCVLLNSDVRVTNGWLTPMLDYMEEHPNVAAIQPKVLADYDRENADQGCLFEHAGAAGGYMDMLGYPYCRGRIMGELEHDHGQYDDVAQVFWTSGCCILTRTRLYKEVGGLDNLFFAHMEEIDYCWRLQTRGYSLVCMPSAVIYHLGGGALPYESPRKTYLNFRNCLLMLYKNTPWQRIFWLMPARCVLDYVAALQYLVRGQFSNAREVVHARLSYHYMRHAQATRSQLRGRRHQNMDIAIDRFPKTIRPFSILVHFYALRHHHFSDL
ncbi:MAG: glycosyltransferase family 2 protein [Paludibacteraceae bacterium]|nr:glycosyltransferase family 2 protein [Paludibacteraceae bacterium]